MENISKKVVDRQKGKVIGFLIDFALDENMSKVGYYVVEEQTESEFFVSLSDMEMMGEVCFIESETSLQSFADDRKSLIGKLVVDEKGVSYGYVKEVQFWKSKCQKILTEKGEILARHISSVGDDVVFLKTCKRKQTNKISKPKKDFSVFKQKIDVLEAPKKVNLTASFYVGKSVTNDVFGYNNERIVSRGEKITKNIFENAKKHNKLNELFFVLENRKNI